VVNFIVFVRFVQRPILLNLLILVSAANCIELFDFARAANFIEFIELGEGRKLY